MSDGRLIDLTHTLEEGMPVHAAHGRTPVKLTGPVNHWEYTDKERRNPYDYARVSFANEQWVINGHTGTHMDSVWHVDPESLVTAERLPVEHGYGSAVWLDCGRSGELAEIGPSELEAAEARQAARVAADDIVLIHTGSFSRAAGDTSKYLHNYSALSKAGGEWLRSRGVRTVGIDAPSVDAVSASYEVPVHTNFLRPRALGLADDDFIVIIENLVNIDAIPWPRFTFIGLPLPLSGGSGSPIRAIAAAPRKEE